MTDLLLIARMAHIAASTHLDTIHRESGWPIRYDPATGASVTEAPPETRAVIDHLQRIRRAFREGLDVLAWPHPDGARLADEHFREVLRLAGVALVATPDMAAPDWTGATPVPAVTIVPLGGADPRDERIARLEGALRPFAAFAAVMPADDADLDADPVNTCRGVRVTVGDWRRARAALADKP